MSALCQKRTSECARAMSALPPKADIGTGPRITFGAPAPAAWRYSPRSAALRHDPTISPLIFAPARSRNIRERLSVVIAHNERGTDVLDGPGRREAAMAWAPAGRYRG